MTKMTRDELLERYAAGEREFKRVDLEGADLEGARIFDGWIITKEKSDE